MERQILEEIREEASKVMETLQRNLARYIVEEYAEAKKRGSKKSK